jgi:malate dehydrogenase (oxaloacetate-decarboxylating)(NADP+)
MGGAQISSLLEAIEILKPTALIGLSCVGGAFTFEVLNKMGELNDKPIVFPLSNPMTNAECSFEDAVRCTNGRVIFASGTAFPEMEHPDRPGFILEPGQGNNMYIFPGLGLGSVLGKCKKVTDAMVYRASVTLAGTLNEEETGKGLLYPRLERIREVSGIVARDVILEAWRGGLVRDEEVLGMLGDELSHHGGEGADVGEEAKEVLLRWVRGRMWVPEYTY